MPRQVPAVQTSPWVEASWSSQAVPSATGDERQVALASQRPALQASAERPQLLPGSRGMPTQDPARQAPLTRQGLSSGHAVPSLMASATQLREGSSHTDRAHGDAESPQS